jgi:hypothetical protein
MEIEGTLLLATVAEDASGIHLRIQTKEGKLEICFLPVNEQIGDISLVLKPGMNAREELEKVASLLNGYQVLQDGSFYPIPGFQQKKVKIVNNN